MHKLWAVCRRLNDHWIGDTLGVVCIFSLIPIVLFLGALLERVAQ